MDTIAPPAPAPAPRLPATTDTPAAPAPASTPAAPAVIDNRPAAVQPESTPPPPAIGSDGKLGENWFLSLGDEFAPHAPDLGKYKDVRDLVKQYQYFQKNGVEYPADGAPPALVDRFRKVAGVPDSPEGYGLTREAMNLPDGLEFDADLAAAVTKAAHATHTPPAALHAIAKEFNAVLAARAESIAKEQRDAQKATQDALVSEWRGDFETNASTVRHITAKLAEQAGIAGDDPMFASFLQDINTNPALSKLMLTVAKLTAEDRIQTPHGFGSLKSPAQQIEDIKAGRDPVWSAKFSSRSEADRLAAYEHIKTLRGKMDS